MKNNLIRRAALILSALLSLTSMSLTAYAQSSEPAEETAPETEEETTAKPFTPEGTGTVVDNATDGDGKEFFTITTPSENVFYLIIDRQRDGQNAYFLNAVTEKDLLALAEKDPEPEVTEPVMEPEPETEPPTEPEPEPEPEKTSGFPMGNILMIAAVLLAGGGAGYYFKPSSHNPNRTGRPSITAQLKETASRTEKSKEPEKQKHHKAHEGR